MKTAWSDPEIIDELAQATPRPHYYYLRRALRPENSLLEVGCATSTLFDYLAYGPPVRFSGCDLTTEMLDRSRRLHTGVTYFEADVQQMSDISEGAYDWVVCSDVLIHVPDPYVGLRHLWRVTAGALLIVIRESDYPEDVVDLNRAYQESPTTRFHYNIWNRDKTGRRLRELKPAPQAVDAYRYWIHLPPESGGPVLPFDHKQFPLWASAYVLLKDPTRVSWLGAADVTFSKSNLIHRALRKTRMSLGQSGRWDPL